MTPPVEPNYFQEIVGEQLSGVTFVMDYLQLQFNPPPIVSAYTTVTVCSRGRTCVSGDDQFRNILCEQITKIVKSIVVRNEEAFIITFEDESTISISLKPSEYQCPEALLFIGRNELRIVI